MKDMPNTIVLLLEKATEYTKSVYELIKLRILDKTLDVVSSFIAHYIVWGIIALFLLFTTFGLAFWLGEMLGRIYYGFFVIAGFYGIAAIVLHSFVRKWFKEIISNYIIKHEFKLKSDD